MSKYLAPIHSWLFNKIQVSESTEKAVVTAFDLNADPEGISFLEGIKKTHGDYLPDEPLENLIDQSNIHGWLQDRIHRTELRSAAMITWLVRQNPENLGLLEQVYSELGKQVAGQMGRPAVNPGEAFKLVHDIILEGMPCDRVQQVTGQTESHIDWETQRCLHEGYFRQVGGDVQYYYQLRTAFINGFLGELPGALRYEQAAAVASDTAVYTNTIHTR